MSAVQFCPSAPGNPKACSESCKPFFVMGFCRTRVCGQPPGGASIGRAFPVFLLHSPLFPSSCLCPSSRDCPRRYRWLPDTHTGLHPYGLRPGAARRMPHIRIIMPAPLRRCRVSSVTAFSQGKKREGNLRSFPLPVAGLWGMARPAAGSQAMDMPSPPKTRTFSSSPQRRSRSRTALGP